MRIETPEFGTNDKLTEQFKQNAFYKKCITSGVHVHITKISPAQRYVKDALQPYVLAWLRVGIIRKSEVRSHQLHFFFPLRPTLDCKEFTYFTHKPSMTAGAHLTQKYGCGKEEHVQCILYSLNHPQE